MRSKHVLKMACITLLSPENACCVNIKLKKFKKDSKNSKKDLAKSMHEKEWFSLGVLRVDDVCYGNDLALQLCALPYHKQHFIHYCLGDCYGSSPKNNNNNKLYIV